MSAAESSSPASPRGAGVAVGAGVEAVLADVERQLAREASALRLVHSATPVTLVAAPPPSPRPVAPPRPPRARRSSVRVVPVPAPAPEAHRDPVVTDPVVSDPVVSDPVVEVDEPAGEGAGAAAPPPRPVHRPVARRIDLDELSAEQRAALGRLQARKVGRVVRDVSPWSVFKFSVLFWVCVWLILTVAGVILWKVGEGAGVVANIEKFYAKASGEKTFEVDGRGVFRAGASIGALLVVALTGLSVLISVLFNLVSDLTGGIRLSVVELESTRRPVRATGAGLFRDRSRPVPDDVAATGAPASPDDALDPDTGTDSRDAAAAAAASSVVLAGDDGVSGRDELAPDGAVVDRRDDARRTPATPEAPAVPSLVPETLVDEGAAGDDAASVRSAAR
jgi:hypothetical protein